MIGEFFIATDGQMIGGIVIATNWSDDWRDCYLY